MKRKSVDDIGVFNILLIGENQHDISIADNIHSRFEKPTNGIANACNFNIVDDFEKDIPANSWFNEFIFEMTKTVGKFNNIVISKRFKEWMVGTKPEMEKVYMSMLLKAMNFVIIDIASECGSDECTFDYDIPQFNFDVNKDFGEDLFKWIDGQLSKVMPKVGTIRLIRSLGGRSIPYLGDVFGCLSGKKYKSIIKADGMRFDVPILFDEFCCLTRGKTIEEIRKSIITRSSSALASFFK